MISLQLNRLLLVAFLSVSSFSYALAQPDTETRAFHVTVTDEKGTPYPGLKPENFLAWVDKEPVKITSVDVGTPATIGLLFDVSGSIGPSREPGSTTFWEKISAGVTRFMEATNQENDYFAVFFDQKVLMTKSWTGVSGSLIRNITIPRTPSGTALFDALYYGIESAIKGRHSRKVILILSDGQDHSSKRTFKELKDYIKKSDVTLYAIGLVPKPEVGGISQLGTEGRGILEELTGASGGRAVFVNQNPKPEVLNEAVDLLVAEIQNQYRVSVETQNLTGPEKWRKLKLKLEMPKEKDRPRLKFRTRDGYYQ